MQFQILKIGRDTASPLYSFLWTSCKYKNTTEKQRQYKISTNLYVSLSNTKEAVAQLLWNVRYHEPVLFLKKTSREENVYIGE